MVVGLFPVLKSQKKIEVGWTTSPLPVLVVTNTIFVIVPFPKPKVANQRYLLCLHFCEKVSICVFVYCRFKSGSKLGKKAKSEAQLKTQTIFFLEGKGPKNPIYLSTFNGLAFYPTPPPLNLVVGFYNNILKLNYSPNQLTAPPPSCPYPYVEVS